MKINFMESDISTFSKIPENSWILRSHMFKDKDIAFHSEYSIQINLLK